MYEETAKKLAVLADSEKEPAGTGVTVAVPKWDLMMAYTAIAKLNDKIKDLESENAHFHRRIAAVMKENDQLSQDFYCPVHKLFYTGRAGHCGRLFPVPPRN